MTIEKRIRIICLKYNKGKFTYLYDGITYNYNREDCIDKLCNIILEYYNENIKNEVEVKRDATGIDSIFVFEFLCSNKLIQNHVKPYVNIKYGQMFFNILDE